MENQLQSIQGKKLNLETQIMTLEDAHLNKETLKAMKGSATAMKSAVKEADLDKADELMDDINDAMEQVHELNEAMSQPLGPVMDEQELEAELAELEEIEADELLNEMPITNNKSKQQEKNTPIKSKEKKQPMIDIDMPIPPSKQVKSKKLEKNEEDELAELDQMMQT
jgi:charged multivesicular body protein 4